MANPYETLGIQVGASADEVKAAYRKLAKQHHPDRNPGDKASEDRFKAINAAHDQINAGWTPQHDQPQHFGFGFGGGGGGGANFHFHSGSGDPFADIFSAMRRQQRPTNRDVAAVAEISLEQAYTGADVLVSTQSQSGRKLVSVKVPAGAHHGLRLMVPQQGDHSIPELPAGNLLVTVVVKPHAVFQRQNNHLLMMREIDMFEAMLGGEVPITGIDGRTVAMKIPDEFVHDAKLRLPGFGMPDLNDSRRGDLFVGLTIRKTPLSEEQRELVQKARETLH